jgi:thiol-disulfide isomerase/thioredoxin
LLNRRRTLALAAGLAAILAGPALAMSTKFTSEGLLAAKASGKPVLVDVSAPWCPVCKAQKAVLAELGKMSKFAGFTILEVDFDSQKDALKALKADKQSTLIVFKGDKEMGRIVGDARKESIEALLAKAL